MILTFGAVTLPVSVIGPKPLNAIDVLSVTGPATVSELLLNNEKPLVVVKLPRLATVFAVELPRVAETPLPLRVPPATTLPAPLSVIVPRGP